MFDRLLSVVVAMSLALLVWLYASSRDQEPLNNITVGVQVMLAPRQSEQYELELTDPPQVTASFRGPPARMRELQGMLQRKELHVVKTITVPDERLKESGYRDAVIVEPTDLNAPLGVTTILAEGHNKVEFKLHRLVERRLPVVFVNVREGPTGPIFIEPPTVLVRGPREVLDRVQSIKTKPSELPSRPGAKTVRTVRCPGTIPLSGQLPPSAEVLRRARRQGESPRRRAGAR
jgi:hypothetical protein